MIRRLRALLKKGDLEHVALDLNELVSEVARLVRSDAIIRNVSMSLELAADLPRVRGDRVQLQQVVLNLVLNGLDAMREPGAGERTLVIRTARDGAGAVGVAVQDAGTGHRREGRGPASSSRSTRPRPRGWAWAWPSRAPSSRRTAARLGAENNPQRRRHLPFHAAGGEGEP